jgi:hypothetical protein
MAARTKLQEFVDSVCAILDIEKEAGNPRSRSVGMV